MDCDAHHLLQAHGVRTVHIATKNTVQLIQAVASARPATLAVSSWGSLSPSLHILQRLVQATPTLHSVLLAESQSHKHTVQHFVHALASQNPHLQVDTLPLPHTQVSNDRPNLVQCDVLLPTGSADLTVVQSVFQAHLHNNRNALQDILEEGPWRKMVPVKSFLAHENTNVNSQTIGEQVVGTIDQIEARCRQLSECVGFNSLGNMFSQLPSRPEWVAETGVTLYAAVNLDMCDAGLHHCHRFASCTNEDRTSVKCTCNNGYLGDGTYCTPIFEADVDTHPLDLLDYQGMRQNQKRGTPRSKVQAYLSSTSYPILQLYRWLTYRTTA
eukprot:m.204535 g.204535  ORF g.204535 m.204535 type:complete len:327 (-) comp15010_c0_seq17:75-1055(-)